MASSIPQIGMHLALSGHYRKRYREITSALLRHGFGFLVSQLGLSKYVPFKYSLFGQARQVKPFTQAQHVRMLFEDLGTTFIKLGQVMSTRIDLLPPEYISELEQLLDNVPVVDTGVIKQTIQMDFGKSVDQLFARFDPIPIASASIGQVHSARLKTGEEVVVKVQRPDLIEQVNTDAQIIIELARLASRRLPIGNNYDLEGIANEFIQTLRNELNYFEEGRNAERFKADFQDDPIVVIPKIFWDYSSERVLVMERLSGLRINNIKALTRSGVEPKTVAKNLADTMLRQVFEFGFFHADPHPANFLVIDEGRIGLLDFGMIGYIDEDTKADLAELFISIIDQRVDGIIDAYIELGVVGHIENYTTLRTDINMLMRKYFGLSIEEINIRSVLEDITILVREHNLRMPANLALLAKTVGMLESLILKLDPEFKLVEEFKPYARKVYDDLYSPHAIAKRSLKAVEEIGLFSFRVPRYARRILGQISRGELAIVTNQPRLDEELHILRRLVNRMIFGIIGSAIIIFVGQLLSFYGGVIGSRLRRDFTQNRSGQE